MQFKFNFNNLDSVPVVIGNVKSSDEIYRLVLTNTSVIVEKLTGQNSMQEDTWIQTEDYESTILLGKTLHHALNKLKEHNK